MEQLRRYGWILLVAVCVIGCKKDSTVIPPTVSDRTIIVYMAADNSLTNYGKNDLNEMVRGMQSVEGNLIVYVDLYGSLPRLVRIDKMGQHVIEEYSEESSAKVKVVSRVVNRVKELYPANSYGLVMWSHGSGWTPGGVTLMSGRARVGDSATESTDDLWYKDMNAPMVTKWICQDGADYIETSDLAATLASKLHLDFILFDACFMSCVEVAYDLRNVTSNIIASPAEILGTGFPYELVLPTLFATKIDYQKACDQFVSYYASTASPSATIAWVDCSQLEALAQKAHDYYATIPSTIVDPSTVQSFENLSAHVFFDMANYYQQLGGDSLRYQAFLTQLERTVPYNVHTSSFWSAYNSSAWLPINTMCGLTTYIPRNLSALSRLQAAYFNTEWAQAVGITDEE